MEIDELKSYKELQTGLYFQLVFPLKALSMTILGTILSEAGEMAQEVKALATEPGDLGSIPHTVEGKNQLLSIAFCSSLMCPHTNTQQ